MLLSLLFIATFGLVSINAMPKTINYTHVKSHVNRIRAQHLSFDVVVNPSLNNISQSWANSIAQNKSITLDNNLGQNIVKIPLLNDTSDLTNFVIQAVNEWYAENSNYNYSEPGLNKSTRHFTQLIWNASTDIGIGAMPCACGNNSLDVVVVMTFSLKGNCNGTFTVNVFPPFKLSHPGSSPHLMPVYGDLPPPNSSPSQSPRKPPSLPVYQTSLKSSPPYPPLLSSSPPLPIYQTSPNYPLKSSPPYPQDRASPSFSQPNPSSSSPLPVYQTSPNYPSSPPYPQDRASPSSSFSPPNLPSSSPLPVYQTSPNYPSSPPYPQDRASPSSSFSPPNLPSLPVYPSSSSYPPPFPSISPLSPPLPDVQCNQFAIQVSLLCNATDLSMNTNVMTTVLNTDVIAKAHYSCRVYQSMIKCRDIYFVGPFKSLEDVNNFVETLDTTKFVDPVVIPSYFVNM